MALTKEDLQAIAILMDDKLEPINARLDSLRDDVTAMKEDVAQIKEDTEITRIAANTLTEWVDEAAETVEIRFPVKKKQS